MDLQRIQDQFNQAQDDERNIWPLPDTRVRVELYALRKQGSVGDVDCERPGKMEIAGRAKWDGWNALKGTDKYDAKQRYVDLVNKLSE
nr:acyl-CoA-binding protein [Streptomyces anulatus]